MDAVLKSMLVKNQMTFDKKVEQSLDEIMLKGGIRHSGISSYDLDNLRRAIRKELRNEWIPKDWTNYELEF